MKKILLIVGILSIILCIFFLLFALLNMHGYYNLFDGSAGLYSKLHRRMIVFLIAGIVLAIVGTVCIIIRSKI